MKPSYLGFGVRAVAVALWALASTPALAVLSTPPPFVKPSGSPLPTVPPAPSSSSVITYFGANEQLDRSGVFKIQEYVTVQPGDNPPASVVQHIPVTITDDQGNSLVSEFKILGASINGHTAAGLQNTTNGTLATITFPLEPSVTGDQKLAFEYSLSPVVVAGPDADVFKVSATGLDWSLPIQNADVILATPGLSPQDLTCSTGAQGSTTSNCRIVPGGSSLIVTDAVLQPGDSLGLYAGFPHNSFAAYYNSWHPGLLLPWLIGVGVILAALITLAIIWRKRRRRHSSKTPSAESQ